jgi:hypothetical protein
MRPAASATGPVAVPAAAAMRGDVAGAEGHVERGHGADEGGRAHGAQHALLRGGRPRPGPVAVEQEQPVDEGADEHPGERQLHDVAREDEERHRGQRQAEPAEERPLPRVPVEIVPAELHHDRAEEGHEQDHRGRERVEPDLEAETRRAEEGRGRRSGRDGRRGGQRRERERGERRPAGGGQRAGRAEAPLRQREGARGGEQHGKKGGERRDLGHGSSPISGSGRGSGAGK